MERDTDDIIGEEQEACGLIDAVCNPRSEGVIIADVLYRYRGSPVDQAPGSGSRPGQRRPGSSSSVYAISPGMRPHYCDQ